MITNYLLNIGLQGNFNYKDKKVRGQVGYVAGIIGLIINLLLAGIKLTIGLSISSIAVAADAFNNLFDAISSIITIVGFKIANRPADKEHPYGHGRAEYLTALMIAFVVMIVGFQFVKSSITRIINPEALIFRWLSVILLLVSVVFKMWLYLFNINLSKKIDSNALRATAIDALVDVIITVLIILSLLISLITDLPIDGYIGFFVSLLILYSGFNLVRDTISPLLGEAPSEKLIENISKGVLSYDHIIGVHDLMVHNYGPGRKIATIDVEVPWDMELVKIHNIIDQAERELSEKYNLHLVIHVDPVGHESREVKEVKREVKERIKENTIIESIHDFDIIEEDGQKCVIFHIVIDGNRIDKAFSKKQLKAELIEAIKEINPKLTCDIVVDIEY